MRGTRLFVALSIAVIAVGCTRQPAPSYVMIDPTTGQPVVVTQYPAMAQQPPAVAAYPVAPQPAMTYPRTQAAMAYPQTQPPTVLQYRPPQPIMAQQQPTVMPAPMPQQAAAQSPQERGLFTSGRNPFSSPRTSAPSYGGPYVAPAPGTAPYGYASAPAGVQVEPYTLDAGDRLRITVFGQEGISNSYLVDAGGNVTLPLIGTVPARGYGTQQLAQMIGGRLRQGYVRDPKVTVEVEAYRPFFILGEVTTPGQYAYVPNMTVETAIAVAGGFGPRASKGKVELTRNLADQRIHGDVPLTFPLRPGDTIVVKERWF